MANSRLSFAIAVKLLTDNFKSGAATVKTQLRSMQMQAMSFVAALGAGTVGLGNFISKLVETAKETSRVNIALKNVSGTAEAYLANQKWLIDLSKKYGVNINALTSGYTKFKAAADITNMSLIDQRKIFESVSRASVAFGLSGEDQKGVFLALAQMMSKNKVMSEELRLQMAERLPVAIQAMAKAAGVSVGELDKLMKQGKILAADVLPRFAEALNEMIPNVDTNNLNKSLSDLGNTFVEFTKNLNIEDKFKSLVECATSILSTLSDNVKWVFNGMTAAIALVFGHITKNILGSMLSRYDAAVTSAAKATERAAKAADRTAKAQEARDAASAAHTKAAETEKTLAVESSEAQKQQARQATHNTELTLKKKELALTRAVEAQKRAEMSVTGGVAAMAAKKGQTAWVRFGGAAKFAIKGIGTTLKSLAASSGITALISGVLWLMSKLVGKIAEAVRISNIIKNANKEANKPIHDSTADTLQSYKKILDDTANSEEKRKGALYAINGLLGTQYEFGKLYTGEQSKQKKNQDELNRRIADQIKLLSLRNRASQIQTVIDEAKFEISKIKGDTEFTKGKSKFDNRKQSNLSFYRGEVVKAGKAADHYRQNPDLLFAEKLAGYFDKKVDEFQKKIEETEQSEYSPEGLDQQQHVVGVYQPELDNLLGQIVEIEGKHASNLNTETPDLDDEDKKKKTELQKQEEKYTKSLGELQAQLDLELITQAEFNDAKRDLIEKMYVEAKGSGDKEILNSDYYKTLSSEYGKSAHGKALKAEQDYAAIMKEYTDGAEVQHRLFVAGMQTQKEYQSALYALGRELKKQLVSKSLPMKGVLPAVMDVSTRLNAPKPDLKTYDDTRDYKKTDTDILADQLDTAKENLEKIRTLYEENATLFTNQLNEAMGNVKSLEDALKIAEAKEAVQNLSKEIKKGLYEGTKNIVSNVDGIVSSFERVGDVLTDSDASAWEKMMAVWQAMTSIVDTVFGVIEFIEKLSAARDLLTAAMGAQMAAETATTAQSIVNTTSLAAANVAASVATTSAASTEMAAKSTAAYAYIPFVGVALAATQIAAMEALIMAASIPKFADGGIVGGNSPSGDKILARLNSGEMVLNQDQQGTLYSLLNGGGSPRNINVTGTFRMRGRDMVAMIDKENRIKDRM